MLSRMKCSSGNHVDLHVYFSQSDWKLLQFYIAVFGVSTLTRLDSEGSACEMDRHFPMR